MFTIRIASRSEQGARQGNEDDLRHGSTGVGWYAVVADGAGGHRRGAEAAHRAVACIESLLNDEALSFTPANLSYAVRSAHALVQGHQDSDDLDARMHCTVVVLWIEPLGNYALWTHVGDSRLYRIRQGIAELLTVDDSVVQRMVRAGLISAEQAASHPQKNQLLSALGIDGDVHPHTVVRPVELRDGDVFLLCTDGWWEGLDGAGLAATLGDSRSPDEWLERMKRHIEARANPKQDNYSAIAVWVGDPGEVTQFGPDDTVPRMRRGG
ncbi:MAG: serine/threonine-protein phosphatase [Burkholderiales bacterium]|nr:serine/threonine-protein phosphatase [Burkholderiales bacterium]